MFFFVIYRKITESNQTSSELKKFIIILCIHTIFCHIAHISRENLALEGIFVMSMDGTMRNKFNWIVYADWLAAVYILGKESLFYSLVHVRCSHQREQKLLNLFRITSPVIIAPHRRSLFLTTRNFTVLFQHIALSSKKRLINLFSDKKNMTNVCAVKNYTMQLAWLLHSMRLCTFFSRSSISIKLQSKFKLQCEPTSYFFFRNSKR